MNGDITNLDTLRFLRTLGSHLIINGTNLTSLRGLDSLTSVADNLVIINNSMLTSLEGLEALTNVGGHVIIRDNGALTSLAGISALGTIGGDVTIVDNENLTLCCESVTLAGAIDAVRIRDGEIGFHTTISGNGSDDCNDVDELIACSSGTVPQAPDPTLTLTSANEVTLPHNADATTSIVFDVANTTWTATSSNTNIVTLTDPTMGTVTDETTVTLTATTASANTGSSSRLDTVTITWDGGARDTMVIITQQAAVSTDPIRRIRRVTTEGDSLADGSSWANAMTLQAVLAASDSLDQVWIAGGTYRPGVADDGDSITDERTATFSVPAGVLVYGGFAGTENTLVDRAGGATILSGDLLGDDGDDPSAPGYDATRDDNSYTVVTIAGADVTIDRLTITAGGADVTLNGSITSSLMSPSPSGSGLYAGPGITGHHADGLYLHRQ